MTTASLVERPTLTTFRRDDVLLIADVETRNGGQFNMTVHAVLKTEDNKNLIGKINENHSLYPGELEGSERNYLMQETDVILRPAQETWHYLAWKKNASGAQEKAWARLGVSYQNNKGEIGRLGLPDRIGYGVNASGASSTQAAKTANPNEKDFVTSITARYDRLDKSYSVDLVQVHMTPYFPHWLIFNQNHPELGVRKIIYTDRRLEKIYSGKDFAKPMDAEETKDIWDKLDQYGHNVTNICKGLNIPDLTPVMQSKPRLLTDINSLNLDAVAGNHCPALVPTYERLGMKF